MVQVSLKKLYWSQVELCPWSMQVDIGKCEHLILY